MEARLKVIVGWKSARRIKGVQSVLLKVKDLNKSVKDQTYQRVCVENMKYCEVGVWRRHEKSTEIY